MCLKLMSNLCGTFWLVPAARSGKQQAGRVGKGQAGWEGGPGSSRGGEGTCAKSVSSVFIHKTMDEICYWVPGTRF